MKEGIGFVNAHQTVENSVLHTLNEASEIFKASQESYLDGSPEITGGYVSKCLSDEGALIGALHSLKLTITYLHNRHYNEPFSQLPRHFSIFCRVLRHCVNREDRHVIDRLSLLFERAAEFVESDRKSRKPSIAFDKALNDFYLEIVSHLTRNVRNAVLSREKAIEDCVASPIEPTKDELSRLNNELSYANQLLSIIAENTQPKSSDRNHVIKLVRLVKAHPVLSKTCGSFPKAIRYVRYEKNPLPELSESIVNARLLAEQNAKGVDAFWNSIATDAKDCNYRKKKSKSANAPPGPVPILYRGAESLAQE